MTKVLGTCPLHGSVEGYMDSTGQNTVARCDRLGCHRELANATFSGP